MPKTRLLPVFAAGLGATLLLAGCGSGDGANGQAADDAGAAGESGGDGEGVTLEVAATQSPMTDVVEAAGEAVQAGYEIELVEVSDYVTANVIVNDGDIDANFSQHVPYMETFNEGNDGTLVGVQPVYNFVIAFYSNTIDDIADLPEGGTVAIPDPASNVGRARKLLADDAMLTLNEAVAPHAAT